MPVYQPLIPTGTVDLDIDYQNLQGNFQQANIVYGTDHYPFDNATPNQGFHNVVTTPPVVNNPPNALPPATVANPKFYAFQQYAELGVLQYSRGPNDAVPSPITRINSPATNSSISPGFPIEVLDFLGMTRVFCKLYAMNTGAPLSYSETTVVWNGTSFTAIQRVNGTSGSLLVSNNAEVLQITNGATPISDVYWTLEIKRVD